MLVCLSETKNQPVPPVRIPEAGICEEKKRLMVDFMNAIHEVNALQNQQTRAVMEGDQDFSRFDVLIHIAHERKDMAKYAWIAHVESHGCGEE